jgi:hypothetical protein
MDYLVVDGFDIWAAGPVVSTGLLSFEPGNPLETPLVPLSRLAACTAPFVVSAVPLVPACAPPWLWLGCAMAAELIRANAPTSRSVFICLLPK